MSNRITGTFSANGNSASAIVEGESIFIHGSGTFGGGLVVLQIQLGDNSTWSNYEGAVFNGNFSQTIKLPAGIKSRLNLSGATSPSIAYELFSESNEGC